MPNTPVSRLAPSPSGALHLGNASTLLVNWALAQRGGWKLVLRIEDLDAPRVRPGAEQEIRDSLAWLGITFDCEQPRQSTRGAAYSNAMRRLAAAGLVFESHHTRRELRGAEGGNEQSPASAPHADGRAINFPASLRPPSGDAWRFVDSAVNHRFRAPEGVIEVADEVAGTHSFDLARDPGDPIVWSKAGVASYQLAVVVDDGAAGVTDVVRGEDLLPSAAIQSALARALGQPVPRWWHLPLVLDEAGRRLSKRDGDLSLQSLRERGLDPRRVIGLVAHWFGALAAPAPLEAREFVACCSPERLRAWSRGPRPRVDAAARSWLGL